MPIVVRGRSYRRHRPMIARMCYACGCRAGRAGKCKHCGARAVVPPGHTLYATVQSDPARQARVEALTALAARGLPLFSGPRPG